MNITSSVSWAGVLTIRFDEKLHLLVPAKKTLSVQSWYNSKSTPPLYAVEFKHIDGSSTVAEYSDHDTWERVLSIVDDVFSGWIMTGG